MGALDNINPNDPNFIEKINEYHAEVQEQSQEPQGFLPPKGPNVARIEEKENEQNQKKMQVLEGLVERKIDEKLDLFRQDLAEQRNAIQQILNHINTPQQPAQPQPQNYAGMNLNDLPPDMKADMLSKVGTSLAQIIQAWKGGKQDNPQGDMYGEMFKQMGLDIVQAGLDGIKQQIYPQFVPRPREINYIPRNNPGPQTSGFR